MSDYKQKAIDFCIRHNVDFHISFESKRKYFDDDTQARNVYNVTITRHFGESCYQYIFKFGDSVFNTEKLKYIKELAKNQHWDRSKALKAVKEYLPHEYDILACLTKYEPTHDVFEFASEYGYEIKNRADFRKVDALLESLEDEYNNVKMLFGDVMEELEEIL